MNMHFGLKPKMAVLGNGKMAFAIVYVLIVMGYTVVWWNHRRASFDDELEEDGKTLKKKGAITRLKELIAKKNASMMDDLMARVQITKNLGDIGVCDFVLESVMEEKRKDSPIKTGLFRDIARVLTASRRIQTTIVMTNSSSELLSDFAADYPVPGNLIHWHWMNPAHVQKLIEIMRWPHTSDDTYNKVVALTQDIGREPVDCPYIPGGIVNRELFAMIAIRAEILEVAIESGADIGSILANIQKLMGDICKIGADPMLTAAFVAWDVTNLIIQNCGFRESWVLLALEALEEKSLVGHKDPQGLRDRLLAWRAENPNAGAPGAQPQSLAA